jgi:hypothetical protein
MTRLKILALAGIILVPLMVLAWFYRYEPIGMSGRVWDRWTHRECEIESMRLGYGCRYDNAKAEAVRAEEDAREGQDKKAKAAAVQIVKLLADPDVPTTAGTERIRILRAAGFKEEEIREWATDLREKLIAAGAPKGLVDDYFGGDPYLR